MDAQPHFLYTIYTPRTDEDVRAQVSTQNTKQREREIERERTTTTTTNEKRKE